MNLLIILLRILEVVVCLMLVGIILVQRNKGSGAGVSFGGGAAEAVFGAQMGNVLTKGTVFLGIIFLANTLLLSILIARQSGGTDDGSLMGNEAPAPVAAMPSAAEPSAPFELPETPAAAEAANALDNVPRADIDEAPVSAPAAPMAAPGADVAPAAIPDAE